MFTQNELKNGMVVNDQELTIEDMYSSFIIELPEESPIVKTQQSGEKIKRGRKRTLAELAEEMIEDQAPKIRNFEEMIEKLKESDINEVYLRLNNNFEDSKYNITKTCTIDTLRRGICELLFSNSVGSEVFLHLITLNGSSYVTIINVPYAA